MVYGRCHTFVAAARDAWAALIAQGGVRPGPKGIFVAEEPSGRKRASLWTLVNVIAAAADLSSMSADAGLDDLVSTLDRYRSRGAFAPAPRHRKRYFDDNAWLGLLFLRLFRRSNDVRHLERGTELASFVRRGEVATGGVLWVEGSGTRNACSTAPAAELALASHLQRSDPDAVSFADRSLAWLRRTLGRDDGLMADHIEDDVVEPTVWSYNQGAALGAHRLLTRATGADGRVPRRLAEASLETFVGERLWQEPPPFLAVWFRELLDADADVRRAGRERLESYLERALRHGRDPHTGLFTNGGIGSYDGRPVIDQAAVVQMFALAAGVDPMPAGASP